MAEYPAKSLTFKASIQAHSASRANVKAFPGNCIHGTAIVRWRTVFRGGPRAVKAKSVQKIALRALIFSASQSVLLPMLPASRRGPPGSSRPGAYVDNQPGSDRNHYLAAAPPLVQVRNGGRCLRQGEHLVHSGFHTASLQQNR